jgi:transposase-like protein
MILHPELIVRMLEEEQGNASAVARRLGCDHATVRYWRRVALKAGMSVPPGLTPQAARRLGRR